MAKRLFDVVVAALGLVVAAPVLLVAAVGIRLSSPGPIIYRARLVGRGGHPFTMYKLRTMHLDHRESRSVITAEGDARVFAFGRPLRRLKIDELKQRNIGTSVHFIPIHLHPYYRDKYGYRPESFPVAFTNYRRMLSLPLSARVSDADAADVISAVLDIVRRYRR